LKLEREAFAEIEEDEKLIVPNFVDSMINNVKQNLVDAKQLNPECKGHSHD